MSVIGQGKTDGMLTEAEAAAICDRAAAAWDVDGVFMGDFTLQRAQPDDTGLMRLELRGAKA